jgi:hypothetical protein
MELALARAAPVRVTFKDYGFFVPTDSAGPRAVQGTVKVAQLSEAQAEHPAPRGLDVRRAAARGAASWPLASSCVASCVQVRQGQPADAAMLAELAGRLFHDTFAREQHARDMRAYLGQHLTEAAMARVLRLRVRAVSSKTPVGPAVGIARRRHLRAAQHRVIARPAPQRPPVLAAR